MHEKLRNKVYFHLSRICSRRMLDIERINVYLKLNGYESVKKINKANNILFFGCAFNNHTEMKSLKELQYLLKYSDNIFVLEGLADTRGEELIANGSIAPEKIIKCREFEKLDRFFGHKCQLKDVCEVNKLYANDRGKYVVQVGHGCNDNCTYCGDKLMIKNLRSKPLDDCIAELRRGINQGYEDIELLGDDVGSYGLDLGLSIVDLLREIVKLEGNFKLSIQEMNIKYLIRNYAELDKIFAYKKIVYLVVAFQSGSNRILQLMKRDYTKEECEDLLKLLSKHDIKKRFHAIVGFPTETFEDFCDTLSLIKNGNFISGSLFIYQDRKYAPAYKIFPKVNKYEVGKRINIARKTLLRDNFKCTALLDKLMIHKK